MEPKQVELSGKVARATVATGSKSEREAVTLQSDDGSTYVLRRQGGPAFGDEALDSLVGTSLKVRGLQLGNTLIMRGWTQSD